MEPQTTSPDAKSQALGRKERRQLKEQTRRSELKPLQEKLASDDAAMQLQVVRELRKHFGGAHETPLDDVIHGSIVPRLLQLSRESSRHDLEFELLWVLTILTTGTAEQTSAVVDHGGVDIFKQLVASPDASVREQAVAILANIAEASVELRDGVVASGATSAIIKMLNADQEQEHRSYYDEGEKVWKLRCGQPEQPISVVRMAARCFSCLCRGQPHPTFGDEMKALLHALETLVMSTDDEVLVKACSALSGLDYSTGDNVAVLIKDGVCARLVELLTHPSREVRSVAARAAEKVATGSGQGMEAILQCRPMPVLKEMLSSGQTDVQRDSCSVVADVLALGSPHFQEVVDAGCVPFLIRLLRSDDEEVKRRAALAVSVLSSKCSPEQVEALIEADCVASMVAMLEKTAFQSSADVGRAALDFVEAILQAGRLLRQQTSLGEDHFTKMVKEADGVRMLLAVTEMSDDAEVCAKAKAILTMLCFEGWQREGRAPEPRFKPQAAPMSA